MASPKSYQMLSVLLLIMISSSYASEVSIISDQNPNQKSSHPRSDEEIMTIFEEWSVEHNKVYNALGEKQRRFEIFKDNLNYIDEHNSRNESYELGLNKFSDLSFEEFSSKYLIRRHYAQTSNTTVQHVPEDDQQVPESIDWRSKGAVTDVKNQGSCPVCWSFGSVAAVEGLMKIATDKIESLSSQELIDCIGKPCTGPMGCSQEDAYNYIKQNGITSWKNYPYIEAKGQCDERKRKNKVFQIDGYGMVSPATEAALKTAAARQPIGVDFRVHRQFQNYKKGTIYDGDCGLKFDHVLTVIGYGSVGEGRRKTDYWLIKNSWGTGWGDNGYAMLKRNKGGSQTSGLCGIAAYGKYPIKNKKGFNEVSKHYQAQ